MHGDGYTSQVGVLFTSNMLYAVMLTAQTLAAITCLGQTALHVFTELVLSGTLRLCFVGVPLLGWLRMAWSVVYFVRNEELN